MTITWEEIQHYELSEKDQQHMVMYGCTQDDMVAMMNEPMNFVGGHYMLAMSILSDAQEIMRHKPTLQGSISTRQSMSCVNGVTWICRIIDTSQVGTLHDLT